MDHYKKIILLKNLKTNLGSKQFRIVLITPYVIIGNLNLWI